MLPLRYARRWQLASLLLLAAVFLAAVVPTPELPRPRLSQLDKWLHALVFALLAIWFAGQYSRGAYWRIAAGLALFGALIEISQGVLPWRYAEWADLWADTVGIVAGLLVAFVGAGGWSQRLESRFEQQSE